MFDSSLDLSDVLKKLKRADESLTEFIAPLWPGVTRAAVWIEGKPQLFRLAVTAAESGYFLFSTEEGTAAVVREAEHSETRRYLDFLAKATVILLTENLAAPASFSERLQGITCPRPIHFASGAPLASVQARYDGINLLYDGVKTKGAESPFSGLFGDSSIFTPGELLDVPGQESASAGARELVVNLEQHPAKAIEYRLLAVLEPAGATLETWSQEEDGIHLTWRRLDEERSAVLPTANSPITAGICLPGTRGFDGPSLTRFLIDHALDAWR